METRLIIKGRPYIRNDDPTDFDYMKWSTEHGSFEFDEFHELFLEEILELRNQEEAE